MELQLKSRYAEVSEKGNNDNEDAVDYEVNWMN